MNTTLLVIIGVIIINWLIAWCDEIFRRYYSQSSVKREISRMIAEGQIIKA